MKKKFLIPEALILKFPEEDVIKTSETGAQDPYDDTGDEWWGNKNP